MVQSVHRLHGSEGGGPATLHVLPLGVALALDVFGFCAPHALMQRPFHLSGIDILPLVWERPLLFFSLTLAALALFLGSCGRLSPASLHSCISS